MSNVLELSNLLGAKNNRIERSIGKVPSKLRLTSPTYNSLRDNITKGLINKNVDKYNNTYSELRNAIVTAEVAAAEQKARDNALNESTDLKKEEERKKQILEDNMIADITSAEVAKDRFEKLKIETLKLEKKFGTLGKNFGVNVKAKYTPKALSVTQLYVKTYKQILKNYDLYKLSDKVIEADSTVEENNDLESKANWRNLFDNIETTKNEEVNVVIDDNRSEEEYIPVEDKGVSEEELSKRNLIGRLGDEIAEVRRLQVSTKGLASPFSAGLAEREENLLSMLSNLSGVENISKRKVIANVEAPNTEFQNFIEQVIGYKKPLTEEEHKEKEQSLQEYYSDPEVIKTIEELRHKDVLYAFNQPEVYEKVMNAERKDNERIAEENTNVDILDYEETEDLVDEDTLMSLGAIKQAELINKENEEKQLIMDSAEEQARMLQEQNEIDELLLGAVEQANLLEQQNELIDIKNGAVEQAKMLEHENEMILLKEGALEQAMMLKTLNDFITQTEKNEKEKNRLKEEADKQAKMLQVNNERAYLKEEADKQAKMLQVNNERAYLKEEADKQARMLQVNNEKAYLKEEADKQAKMLQVNNERAYLKEEADKQAKMLQVNNERAYLKEEADKQARMLQVNNEKAYLKEEADKQAKMLQVNNEKAYLKEGADIQAKMLQVNNERAYLKEGADKQARMIQATNERAFIIEEAKKQAILLQADAERAKKQDRNERAALKAAAKEQAIMLANTPKEANTLANIADQIVIQNTDEPSENSKDDDLVASAEVEAKNIQLANAKADMMDAASNQARMLIEENKKGNHNIPMFEVLYPTDRYCSIVSVSKPLRISSRQRNSISSFYNGVNDLEIRKEALHSLKQSLQSEGLDFLRYPDAEIGHKLAA